MIAAATEHTHPQSGFQIATCGLFHFLTQRTLYHFQKYPPSQLLTPCSTVLPAKRPLRYYIFFTSPVSTWSSIVRPTDLSFRHARCLFSMILCSMSSHPDTLGVLSVSGTLGIPLTGTLSVPFSLTDVVSYLPLTRSVSLLCGTLGVPLL